MKIAFLTEMSFTGKIPADHPNMRTEFAWMHALDADHHNIYNYSGVKSYDIVVLIFPQGNVMVDCHGVELPLRKPENLKNLLTQNPVECLKQANRLVYHMQEGPAWLFNEYDVETQFYYYQNLLNCDLLLAHNQHDSSWYKGLFPENKVGVMPSLMISDNLPQPQPQESKTIIGGNFARWYGGFQSFIVAQEFEGSKWTQDSHAKRTNEDGIQDLNHLPRVSWIEWMKLLSTFKYAIHLMPTVAAGTFSLNCAYYGLPCIGNIKLDTQRLCHPDLSVDVDDIQTARMLAVRLRDDLDFYRNCQITAKQNYEKHYSLDVWKQKVNQFFKI